MEKEKRGGVKLLEKHIQSQITAWLTVHRVFWYRANTGAMKGEHKGKGWFVRFGKPGMPDIIAVMRGIYVGIEVKRPGENPTLAQQSFGVELESAGGVYVVMRSLDDVEFLKRYL